MSKTDRIRQLNDDFRTTFFGGHVLLSYAVAVLPPEIQVKIKSAVKSFTAFNTDNDPHDEHDFGSFEVDGEKYFFKIDYYDAKLEFGSEDASDPKQTTRVLTIMLPSDY